MPNTSKNTLPDSTPSAGSDERSRRRRGAGHAGRDPHIWRLLGLTLVIFAGMSLARPDVFPTVRTVQAMAVQFPEIGILALAMMVTMLTGGIDLSVVSMANLAAIVTSLVLNAAAPEWGVLAIPVAILAALSLGAVAGFANGLLIARVGITPILATLGTMTLYTGISTVITGGTSFFAVPEFVALGSARPLGVPLPLLFFALLALLVSLMLNRSVFGYRLYLFGTNPVAALFSGIDNVYLILRTYFLSGLLSASAGLVFLARSNAARPDYGESYVLLVVLIAILGGVNYKGGFGRVSGIVLAVLILQILSTGLNMLLFRYSGSNFLKEFAWGAVLLLVMALGRVRVSRRGGTARIGRAQVRTKWADR